MRLLFHIWNLYVTYKTVYHIRMMICLTHKEVMFMINLSADDKRQYIEVLLALSGFGAMKTEKGNDENIVHGIVHETDECTIFTNVLPHRD